MKDKVITFIATKWLHSFYDKVRNFSKDIYFPTGEWFTIIFNPMDWFYYSKWCIATMYGKKYKIRWIKYDFNDFLNYYKECLMPK